MKPRLHVSCRSIAAGWSCSSLVVCLLTWYLIERTRLGAYLRARPPRTRHWWRAFGVNVPRMITLTYGLGVGLAALGRSAVGADQPGAAADGRRILIIVVVRGGGDRRHGFQSWARSSPAFALGVIEGLTKYFLSRSIQHRGICPDGAGAACETFGTDRTGRPDMAAITDNTIPVTRSAIREEMIAFGHHDRAVGDRSVDRSLSILRDAGGCALRYWRAPSTS